MPGATPSVHHNPATNAATASSSRNSQVMGCTRAPRIAMPLKAAAMARAFTARCRSELRSVPIPQMKAPTLAIAPASRSSNSRPRRVASSTATAARTIAHGSANARWTRSPSRPAAMRDDHKRISRAPCLDPCRSRFA
jgi:hypothetical protein